MPVSFPPIEKDALKAIRNGDESALERLFRARYAGLSEEGGKQLEDPAFGPRLAVNATLQLWDDRARFENAEEFEAGCTSALHGAVIREKRRRGALHRMESHEAKGAAHKAVAGPANVEEAWKEIATQLHAPKVDAAAKGKVQFDAKRHEASAHIAGIGKRGSVAVPIATAVIILAGVGGALWWVNRGGAEGAVTLALSSPDSKNLSSSVAIRGDVTLSDSGTVNLGSESKVTVPPTYGDKLRAVRLTGSATFTVKHDKIKPFEVRAGNTSIVATGTIFSVRAFPEDDVVVVKVKEGSVTVKVVGSKVDPRPLATGAALVIALDGSMKEPTAEALDEALGWTEGKMVFVNRPLSFVIPQLKRWYDFAAQIRDSSILTRMVTMTAGIESKKDAITALEKAANVKYGYDGQQPVLRDAGGGGAKAAQAKPAAKPAAKAAKSKE